MTAQPVEVFAFSILMGELPQKLHIESKTMKTFIIADLHLDLWMDARRDPLAGLMPDDWSDVAALIIAGDLTNKPRVRWKHAIRHLSHYIDASKIHIIPGNHDYYDFQLDGDDRLAEIAGEEGARLAQKTELFFGDTRFLCCTLWTDFELYGQPAQAQAHARAQMNDYRYIRNASAGYRKIRPYETALIHLDHKIWLEEQLSKPFAGRTAVVTHHCPHPALISAGRTDLDPVYGSNLMPMIEIYQPDYWVFGHTHYPAEVREGRTLIRNLSLGYPDQVSHGEEADMLRRGLIDLEPQNTPEIKS